MNTKSLALILVVLAVLAPVTYVLAVTNSSGSTYGMMGGTTVDRDSNNMVNGGDNIEDQDWWDEMLEYMEDHVDELNATTLQGTQESDFGDWWDDMTGIMEDHFGDLDDEEWFDEMKTYMEAHWDEVKDQSWFDDMTEHMEDHMGNIDDEEWFDEMEEHMDDMMGGGSRNGRGGCH